MCNTHSERINEKLREQYSKSNREVKKATKMDRKNFIENMANEAEKAASKQRMVMFIRSQRSYVDKREMHACQ